MPSKAGRKSRKPVTIKFLNEAADCTRAIQKITKRTLAEVCSDAFRSYLWILFEQTLGNKIESHRSKGKIQQLARLVKNKKTAEAYFKSLNWM